MKERTLKKKIKFKGKGIHTGEITSIILYPQNKGGIRFLKNGLEIEANLNNVTESNNSTILYKDGETIMTVEHLLSAIFGAGIDHCLIETDGPEIPIMDGSSLPFYNGLKNVGFEELKKDKVFFQIKALSALEGPGKYISATQFDKLSIYAVVSFPYKFLFLQEFSYTEDKNYGEEIAPARTFGLEEWVSELKNKGLIKGADLTNVLYYDKNGPVNTPRFESEVVRHKILDFIGDLSLLSVNIKGKFIILRGGHNLHHKFLKMLSNRSVNEKKET